MIPPLTTNNIWIYLIGLILSGGGLKSLFDAVQAFRHRPSPADRHVSTVDASIITLARAQDELAEDNGRLRQLIAEERTRWDQERVSWSQERAAWNAERLSLREEIANLEAQVRREREEANVRYDRLLTRLAALSARHTHTDENDGGL